VQVHLALLVKQNLDMPPAKATSGLPQLQLGQLGVVEELSELVRQPLYAKDVLVDADDELEGARLLQR
jgi:hypothetical protein